MMKPPLAFLRQCGHIISGYIDDQYLQGKTHNGISELNWWLCNLDSSCNTIRCPPVDVTLYSDASLQGWGAVMNKKSTGGMWLPTERGIIHKCLHYFMG